jgi:tubulin polyglutamylase TTLL6/13
MITIEAFDYRRSDRLYANVSLCKYAVVRDALRSRDFKLITDKEKTDIQWDIWWMDCAVNTDRLVLMQPWQRINHWPGMACLHRKDGLARTVRRLSDVAPDFDFVPSTYVLPDDWAEFSRQFDSTTDTDGELSLASTHTGKRRAKHTFIVKPAASCQGTSILVCATSILAYPCRAGHFLNP